MENTSPQNQEASNLTHNQSNADLIYDYTESLIKTQSESINRLDTKMSAFLAFAGISLRFATNLPGQVELSTVPGSMCNTCLVLQIIVCVSAVSSALINGIGLTAKFRGGVLSPKQLMENKLYQLDAETLRCQIINNWIETEKEYLLVAANKRKLLNCSIWLTCISITAFALDVVIASIYT